MPTAEKRQLRVTINDPAFIAKLIQDVDWMLEEMRSINVRNTPVKYETKRRWEDKVEEVRAFLARFVPQPHTQGD